MTFRYSSKKFHFLHTNMWEFYGLVSCYKLSNLEINAVLLQIYTEWWIAVVPLLQSTFLRWNLIFRFTRFGEIQKNAWTFLYFLLQWNIFMLNYIFCEFQLWMTSLFANLWGSQMNLQHLEKHSVNSFLVLRKVYSWSSCSWSDVIKIIQYIFLHLMVR